MNSKPATRRAFLKSAAALTALGLVCGRSHATEEQPVKIGFVGTGRLGSVLSAAWVKAGHEVMLSSLDLEHDRKLAAQLGPKARAGTSRDAAAFGEVIFVAVPYSAMPQVGKDIGPLVKDKIVIDASNPIPSRDGAIATWARDKGAGLASAELLPGARLVRTLNAIGSNRLTEAAARGGIGMPMASDDAGAMALAARLVKELGLEPVAVGPLSMGRYLMPGTPLAGEHSPEDIRRIASTLKP